MTAKIDFTLNEQRFGTVERTIFRLVLNGLTSAQHIGNILWVFSDSVVANAIKRLVNQQILCADIESRSLSLSEPVTALIEACMTNEFDTIITNDIMSVMTDGKLYITDVKVKEIIISNLLPNIKLDRFAKELDFVICERGIEYEE